MWSHGLMWSHAICVDCQPKPHTECKAPGYKVLLWLQVDGPQAWEMDPDQNDLGPLSLPSIFVLNVPLPAMGSKPQASFILCTLDLPRCRMLSLLPEGVALSFDCRAPLPLPA